MPLLNGLDAGYQAKRLPGSVKLVFLTMNTDHPALAAKAIGLGASAYLLKTCAASELIVAVREALGGRPYFSPTVLKETVDPLLHPDREFVDDGQQLTQRQREVLRLLSEGKSMKQAAYELNVTADTVAGHKYRIMEILNAKTSVELVQYAMRNHIIAA